MKFNIITLTVILLTSTLFSCSEDEITNEIVESAFSPTGCWIEMEDESMFQFSGTNYTFCFLNDTMFTLKLESWTDIVVDINSPIHWSEYIKGTYVLTNESFEISGNYMDVDFMNFELSHFGETELEKTFEVKVVSESEIILNNNEISPHLGIRLLN